jgi:hypothetical protein
LKGWATIGAAEQEATMSNEINAKRAAMSKALEFRQMIHTAVN